MYSVCRRSLNLSKQKQSEGKFIHIESINGKAAKERGLVECFMFINAVVASGSFTQQCCAAYDVGLHAAWEVEMLRKDLLRLVCTDAPAPMMHIPFEYSPITSWKH